MHRILMVSYFAPPLLSAESILVAKTLPYLAEYFKIDLLTVGPDPEYRRDEDLLQHMQHDNLRIFRYRNPKFQNKIMRRLYEKGIQAIADVNIAWVRQAVRHHFTQVNPDEYRLIYSRSQPGASHLVALAFRNRLGIPWVAQFSDPWAHNPYHPGNSVVKRHEKQVVRAVDRYVFPTVEMCERMDAHYPGDNIRERSKVIPHCFDPALYPNPSTGEKGITLSYIGDFYGLRSPEPLLQALSRIREMDPDCLRDVRVQVVGNVEGKFRALIDQYRERVSVPIERVGQVPYLKSLEKMKQSDILLLIDAPGDVNLFLPSKLIDYFGARKPIMGITPIRGTAGQLLQQYGFPVADPLDVENVARGLLQMIRDLPAYREKAVGNAYERFSAQEVAKELRDLFVSMI
jgi:glycosyltransferase involved in cell wall biosynthesis